MQAVAAELQDAGQDRPPLPKLFERCADWRRRTYGDVRGFVGRDGEPNFSTWLRDFWREGGLEIFEEKK